MDLLFSFLSLDSNDQIDSAFIDPIDEMCSEKDIYWYNLDEMENMSGEDLYREALQFKLCEDYTRYSIYMVMSANKNYDLAIKHLFVDYTGDSVHLWQDHSLTKQFYEETQEYQFSQNYLGFMYYYGIGVQKDEEKAREYHRKCFGEPLKITKEQAEDSMFYDDSYKVYGLL